MKIKVITLKPDGERFKKFKESATKYNITYDVVPGVDTSNVIRGDKMSSLLEVYEPGTTKGMLGCTLAHMNLFEQCAEDTEPWLILEDDARFLPNIDLDSVEKEFLKSTFGVLHLQTNDLRFFKEDDKGLFRIKPLTSISTCAYIIKPEAAKSILGLCNKTKDGDRIAKAVIDRFLILANKCNIKNGIQIPLMVCHSGIDTIVANSSYLEAPLERKIRGLFEHKTDALERVSLEVYDNTTHGTDAGSMKVRTDKEIIDYFCDELLLLREEELLLAEGEKEEFLNNLHEIEDTKLVTHFLNVKDYRTVLTTCVRRYRNITKNAIKRQEAIKIAATVVEVFKAIKIKI